MSIRIDKPYMQKTDKTSPYGFSYVPMKWEDIGKKLKANVSYTAGAMKDNHRKETNYIQCTMDLIMYDIDDGMTVEECQETLKDVKHIILTTENHKKDKHGIVCDRFRVIIQMDTSLVECNSEEYKQAYKTLGTELGLPYDNAAQDISRFFASFAGAEYYYNDGEPIDFNDYIFKARRNLIIKRRNSGLLTMNSYSSGAKINQQITPDNLKNNATFIKYKNEIVPGNMHFGMMSIIGYFRKSGCQEQDVLEWLLAHYPQSKEGIYNRIKVYNKPFKP
jgi:hypothetical protein